MIWQPRQQTALRWVSKAQSNEEKGCVAGNDLRNTHLQATGFTRLFYGRKAIIRGFLAFGFQKILPNTQPRAKQAAIVRAQDTKKASRQWVPTSQLMAQGHCVGNSKIGIPKRALPTSSVIGTTHEAIKVLDKGKQIIQEPALAPMVLPIKNVKSTYQQGGSSCKSLENLSHPSSTISPIP